MNTILCAYLRLETVKDSERWLSLLKCKEVHNEEFKKYITSTGKPVLYYTDGRQDAIGTELPVPPNLIAIVLEVL